MVKWELPKRINGLRKQTPKITRLIHSKEGELKYYQDLYGIERGQAIFNEKYSVGEKKLIRDGDGVQIA